MQIVFFYWPFWIYRFIKLLRKYLMAFQTITEVFRNFGEDGRYAGNLTVICLEKL